MRAQSCPSEIIQRNRAATVFITAKAMLKQTVAVETHTGSGFVISSSGYVLTSTHVVKSDVKVDDIEIALRTRSSASNLVPAVFLKFFAIPSTRVPLKSNPAANGRGSLDALVA
jgi:S1-C subfamily serine protease